MNPVTCLLHSTILVCFGLHALGSTSTLQDQRNQEVNNNIMVAKPNDLAQFSDMFGECRKRHSVRVLNHKNKRSSVRIFENLSELLNVLRERSIAKRDPHAANHVAKCLQQSENTVTCFAGGKFYQFEGDLKTIVGANKIKTKRCYCNRAFPRANHNPEKGHNPGGSLLTKRLSSNVGCMYPEHSAPYQEVMMEPKSRKASPQRCYGFVAPQALRSKKTKGRDPKTSNRASPSNYAPQQRRPSGNQRLPSLKHSIEKRSQMVSVACRPMYIPTARPSVNEGKVPQCRIPCGAHNCGPYPTCPCRPPCKTPAPPPTTCPPIPGLAESEATMTFPTRCPAYEFTDEPCPSFECKDGCPYLTTPGCQSACGLPKKGDNKQPRLSDEVVNATSEHRMGMGISPQYHSPYSTAMEGRGSTVHQTTMTPVITVASSPTVHGEDKVFKGNFSSAQGRSHNMTVTIPAQSNSTVTGKPRLGSPLRTNGAVAPIDSTLGSRVPAVWSSFDFKKLLKSAKSHFKDKVELINRNHNHET